MSTENKNVSALTIKEITTANRQTEQAQSNYSKACQRAVRLAYSRDSVDDCNFIITNSTQTWRKRVVSYFKQAGLVVIENRGELPRVDRVADKKAQGKVFETLASKLVGDTSVLTAEAAKDLADKKAEHDKKRAEAIANTPIKDRVLNSLTKAFAEAQKTDADLSIALGFIINQYKLGKIKA